MPALLRPSAASLWSHAAEPGDSPRVPQLTWGSRGRLGPEQNLVPAWGTVPRVWVEAGWALGRRVPWPLWPPGPPLLRAAPWQDPEPCGSSGWKPGCRSLPQSCDSWLPGHFRLVC